MKDTGVLPKTYWHEECYKIAIFYKGKETEIEMTEKTKSKECTDWDRLQCWLQEASMVLDYCTRLAIAKRTGDSEGAMGDNFCFHAQLGEDREISEPLIRDYVVNIGKLAEAGWATNMDFPVFGEIDRGEK